MEKKDNHENHQLDWVEAYKIHQHFDEQNFRSALPRFPGRNGALYLGLSRAQYHWLDKHSSDDPYESRALGINQSKHAHSYIPF